MKRPAVVEGCSWVEFRRDPQGRAALMKVNPRLWSSLELSVHAGVPFPRLLYDWASGNRLESADGYRTEVRMRWLGGARSWLRAALAQASHPDVPSRARALPAFAAEFARTTRYDYRAHDTS